MSLPYFPMYPTDFEADTSHLSLEEDGAYNRLLRLMWMTPGCSLPDDDRWIMRRMRCDQATFDRVVAVIIDEFLSRKGGRIFSKRLLEEWQKSDVAHRKRVSAGLKGGKVKAQKTKENKPSNALAKPKQPEPEPEPLKSNGHSAPNGASDRGPLFDEFWKVWPLKRQGKQEARNVWGRMRPEDRRDAVGKVETWGALWRKSHPDASDIHPVRYLRNKRWQDEATPIPKQKFNY